MATLYKRRLKSGEVWYAQLFDGNGRRVAVNLDIATTEPRSRKLAEKRAVELELLAGSGQPLQVRAKPTRGALHELARNYLDASAQRDRPGTLYLKRRALDSFLELTGVREAAQLDRKTVELFISRLRQRGVISNRQTRIRDISDAGVNVYLRYVRAWLRWGVEEGLIRNWTPPRLRQLPVTQNGPRDFWTTGEAARFLRECRGRSYRVGGKGRPAAPVLPFFLTLLLTGMREGEALGLRWTAFTPQTRSIKVWGQKTKTRREIPLPGLLWEVLQLLPKAAPGPFWEWKPRAMWEAFHEIRLAAGLPPIKLHNLRDTFAMAMDAEGVSLRVIQAWLGHSSLTITGAHYLRPGLDEMRAAPCPRGSYENALRAALLPTACLPEK